MKQVILGLSVISYSIFLYYQNQAPKGLCDSINLFVCQYKMDSIWSIFTLLGITAFFSLLTYKMPSRVFMAWWKFARISIPLILAIIVYINLNPLNSGGFFNMDNEVKILQLTLLYSIFIIGSLIQIYRGYRNK